ncbi:hypothetical protein AeMF1_008722 [Aphanomyces euteiches]|nr:hypothetical protein AeMF1_008722 [Aphanomyces euteiches]
MPWEYDLQEGEELGFLSDEKVGEEGNHQALLNAKLMDRDTIILADTGADMSVVHLRAVESLNLPIDHRNPREAHHRKQHCFYLELDVCDLGNVGFNAVLGMDFLSRAHMTIDTNRREISLPGGEQVPLLHQPTRYHRGNIQYLETTKQTWIASGESVVVPIRHSLPLEPDEREYWVHRGAKWIATLLSGVDEQPVV